MSTENNVASQPPSTAKGPSVAEPSRTTNTPQVSNAGRKRRSCYSCSKRKVKCDKQKPCRNCAKIGAECVFPPVPPKPFTLTPELAGMLDRLEKVAQNLEPGEKSRSESNVSLRRDAGHERNKSLETVSTADLEATKRHKPADGNKGTNKVDERVNDVNSPHPSSSHEGSPGRIVRDNGRDRYVRKWFWDVCINEASNGFMTDDEDEDEGFFNINETNDCSLSSQFDTTTARAAISQTRPDLRTVDERLSHVLPGRRQHLWNMYKERVHPLTKLLHLPSMEHALMEQNLDSNMQCILLAMYYGAVTSLTEEECITLFQEGQAEVLLYMRHNLERMFAKAKLMHTGDIRPLQALILYLTFLRHHDARLSWNLSGLAVRLAQNFGLHREGSLFGLSKFELEMRRRLWWQMAIMDAPSAEDYSGEYTLLEMSSFDTRLPQNLDDVDLNPDMTEYPPEKSCITEMTLILARCEITEMYRCIADARRLCGKTGKTYADFTPRERSSWIDACEARFSERFLQGCSTSNPFHWVTVIFSRMLFNKVRLHGWNPLRDKTNMAESDCERLFLVAVDVIELNHKLRTDPRTRPWLWLFSSYHQWHALSLVLTWLQMNPLIKNSQRVWRAVEKAIVLRWENPSSIMTGKTPQQWRSMIKLLERARLARSRAMAQRVGRNPRQRGSGSRSGISPRTSSVVDDGYRPVRAAQPTRPWQSHQPHQRPCSPKEPAATNIPLYHNFFVGESSSQMDLGAMLVNPETFQDLDGLSDFSVPDINSLPFDSDFASMAAGFPEIDFRGLQNFSGLEDML